ncbi:ArnT family glycosyltransferase [Arcobacter roscoffensis]|uniref:Glycosyltransferase family 39 protein n=1 Tax=Arcobacter roscoffensis TaxID=2961520 RepID=A0ABY5E5R4_9BACT|nr:glycosyltransferase family 39 protein [Arcobacter roscoffensis]UTJ06068.1 glycosyltransferase family 39 protein [Arcobacter roscoffensis]
MTNIKYDYLFYLILSFLVVILVYVSNTLSISYKEALNVFENSSVLSYITNSSIYIFGQNDIALRLPFIIFYTLSILLMYELTNNYFKYKKDQFLSILIFMILPGVLSASLLVNSAIIVLFFTLLYIYLYERNKAHPHWLLFLLVFIDNSFAIFFLALFFYSLKEKDKKTIYISLFLFSLSMYIYGFETDGKPKGYFLDTFAIYATIFSPLVFIYFIYTIYRAGIKNKRNFVWYITTTALLVSLLFSFRQRVYIEDFAPYVVISIPFMLKMFYHSYRIRLSIFRKKHYIGAIIVLSMLVINCVLTVVNKPLYLFLPNEKKHFAYKYHFAKEIAAELKKYRIKKVNVYDERLQLRLKYYGIEKSNDYYLLKRKYDNYKNVISISYYNKELIQLYLYEKK